MPYRYAGLLLVAAWFSGQAQPTRTIQDHEVLPPSPTVASLGTYGTMPVSNYTGLPEVSVPLHTITAGGVSIPITLSYHSSGLLVDERASNVGLGWSCSGLNVIGHVIMGGKSDFGSGGYQTAEMHPLPSIPYFPDPNTWWQSYADDLAQRTIDNEPDIYQYSFPGHSGKFLFDRQGVAHCIPYDNLRITYSRQTGDDIDQLEITDEAGNRFTFKAGEFSGVSYPAGCGPRDGVKQISGSTAYFLQRIITPTRDTVRFTYDSVIESYNNPQDLTEYALVENSDTLGTASCTIINPPHNCIGRVDHGTQVVRTISYRGETVLFTYEGNRADMAGGVRLSGIQVTYRGVLKKQFQLYHSYFGTAGVPVSQPSPTGETTQDHARLRLDSVRQVGMPAYRFAYHLPTGATFPPIHAYAQDRWGYYNGQNANTTLIINPFHPFTSANRDSDSTAVRLGMLRQITYPTGGTTTFTYEANIAYKPESESTELELLAANYVSSPYLSAPAHRDTTFTIVGKLHERFRTVYAAYNLPSGRDGGTFTGGSAFAVLEEATGGKEYYRMTSGGIPTSNADHPLALKLPCNVPLRLTVWARGADPHSNPGSDSTSWEYFVSLRLLARKIIPGGNQVVGGCRIKRITHDGQAGYQQPGSTYYKYDSLGVSGLSSGFTLSTPLFTSRTQVLSVAHHGQHQPPTNYSCIHAVYMQNSVNQSSLLRGCVAAYKYVTVLRGPVTGAPTQRSIYCYSAEGDEDVARSNTYPFPPPTSFDWLRGRLLQQQDFRFTGQEYQLVRTTTHTYRANFNRAPGHSPSEPPGPYQAIITGYRVFTVASGQQEIGLQSGEVTYYGLLPYYYYSASVHLIKTEEVLYDEQQRPFTHVKLLDYNHATQQVWRERIPLAPGDTLVNYTHYLPDSSVLPAGSHSAMVQALRLEQQQHILNRPVETARYRYRAGQPERALQRTLALRSVVNGMSLPQRTYTAQGGNLLVPISYVDLQNDSLVYDAAYRPLLVCQRYDNAGHLLQQSLTSGRPAAYLYGYRQQLLTAHAVNAAYPQLAYTSFEESATGRWRYDSTGTHRVAGGRTGQWAYRLDGAAGVQRDRLPAGDYELLFWAQAPSPPQVTVSGGSLVGGPPQHLVAAPGNWHQFRARLHLTGPGGLRLDVAPGQPALLLDEVRLHPVGAQLTTYTHDPLVGMTSQTGPDGRTLTYEYDALGRLVRTRDEQGRILSQQQYHYAGQ